MTDTLARALEPANEGIDRRKLLKVGAWAAPVVVLAAAVPAASASGTLQLGHQVKDIFYTWGSNSLTGIAGTFRVDGAQLAGTNGATDGVTLVVKIGSQGLDPASAAVVGSNTGWQLQSSSNDATNHILTLTFLHGGSVTPTVASSALNFSVAALSGFQATTNRAWNATATAAGLNNTAITAGIAFDNVKFAALPSGSQPIVAPSTPVPSPSPTDAKVVTVKVNVSSNGAIKARMTITNAKLNGQGSDDGFASWAAPASPAGGSLGPANQTVKTVAESVVLPIGFTEVTFPAYTKQSGNARSYKIEYFSGNTLLFTQANLTMS